jgi:type I restriction enzyme M protein
MAATERDNPALKGVLPKDYARPTLDKERLGQLIDLISNIKVGDEASRAKDVLGRVYEYFLSQFASAEGKKGGEFYTPRCIVKLLVEMIEPYRGRVYDPCCGSSGMFVQSVEFIRAHAKGNGNPSTSSGQARKVKADISIYGQESNCTTWRLARMNLAIRGIDSGQIAHGDSFHNDRHPDLRADFILANPPFNVSDWRGEKDAGKYEDIAGFCKSAPLDEIRKHGHILTPGRYVGAEAQEDDREPFEEKMKRLVAQLREQQAEGAKLDAAIDKNLKDLGYGK